MLPGVFYRVVFISPTGNPLGVVRNCYSDTFKVQYDSRTILRVYLGKESFLRKADRRGR